MKQLLAVIKSSILLCAWLLITTPTFAQGPPDGDDTMNTPIDGGLSMLLAAGVGYGVKKIYGKRKTRRNTDEKEIK